MPATNERLAASAGAWTSRQRNGVQPRALWTYPATGCGKLVDRLVSEEISIHNACLFAGAVRRLSFCSIMQHVSSVPTRADIFQVDDILHYLVKFLSEAEAGRVLRLSRGLDQRFSVKRYSRIKFPTQFLHLLPSNEVCLDASYRTIG